MAPGGARSVWTRPAFVASAALLLTLVILAVWVVDREQDPRDGDARPTASADPSVTGATDDSGPQTDGSGLPTDDAADGDAGDGGDGDDDGGGGDGDGGGDGGDGGTTSTEPSVCGLGPAELDGTVTRAPDRTEWSLVGAVAAPSVVDVGPGTITPEGLRTCYRQTPTGSLVMAANVVAMGGTDLLVPRMIESMTAAGPGREAAVARLGRQAQTAQPTDDAATDGSTVVPSTPQPAARFQIRGFRMLTYAGDRASVDIAISLDNGATGSFVVDMRWEGGDWKVVLTEDGQLGVPPAQVPNLAGYTPWSGA